MAAPGEFFEVGGVELGAVDGVDGGEDACDFGLEAEGCGDHGSSALAGALVNGGIEFGVFAEA